MASQLLLLLLHVWLMNKYKNIQINKNNKKDCVFAQTK